MTIETHARGVAIVDPKGRLTVETVAAFSEAVRRLIDMGHTRILLNLADVPRLDASGLGAIAGAAVEARRSGGELALLNPTARSRHLLTITGLVPLLRAYDTTADALASVCGSLQPSFRPAADGEPAMLPYAADGATLGEWAF
jgi:anti-sigma B factor antagonist